MKFKTHPVLKELTCNENGSVITWKGRELVIHEYTREGKSSTIRTVNFKGATHTVSKIVCEVWNGMRDSPSQQVKRHDNDCNNDHYSNLFWGNRGRIHASQNKRSSLSKIKPADIPIIVQRIKDKDLFSEIARDYNTSSQSISRINLKYVKDE